MRAPPIAIPAALLMAAGVAGARRYRSDLAEAAARLAAVERRTVVTSFGAVEYAERGSGDPLLVSHGIFHGCDGGLLSVRDIVAGRRVIAPSRFGYLGSAMPASPTTADQADAFLELLDGLQLGQVDVIAISAGTSAAVQLALRHPDRVRHLVISSGHFPGSGTAQAPPDWAKLFYSDPAMWLLKVFARPMFAGLMGVPAGFPRDVADAHEMAKMLDSIFPIGPRVPGAIFDAYVGDPDINEFPFEALRVPTMILHATDDPLASYSAAVDAAARITQSRLISLDSGGHLQLGQSERVRAEVAAFLGTPAEYSGLASP